MTKPPATFEFRSHVVRLERLEKHRWKVTVDGRFFASFCSESRARPPGGARRGASTSTPPAGTGPDGEVAEDGAAPSRPGGKELAAP
jgi:hypothetical protein